MAELASHGQLRLSLLRWALVLIPGTLLLGMVSGAVATSGPGNPWFATLAKPSLYPPPLTFAVVWTLLYILMGLALTMIVCARGAPERNLAIVVFVMQFALNLAWSPMFFAAHQITAALALLIVLDVAVLVTILLFHRIRPVAALVLAPYLLWLLFATYLTWEIHAANPGADGKEVSGAVTRVEF